MPKTMKRKSTTYKKKPYKKKRTSKKSYGVNKLISNFSSNKKPKGIKKTYDIQWPQFAPSVNTSSQWNNEGTTKPSKGIIISQGNAILCINEVTQGAAISQRIGNKIAMASLELSFSLLETGRYSAIGGTGRILVIYDRQPSPNIPAPTDIFSGIEKDGTVQIAQTCLGLPNPNYFERFVTLMDYKMALPPSLPLTSYLTTYPIGTQKDDWVFNKYIKLKGLETNYKANTGTIGDLATGALYLCVMGDFVPSDANGSTNADPWCLIGQARLRFYDA